MTVLADVVIDASAVVPDSVEVVELHRVWRFRDGRLWSATNDEVWTPGEPLVAKCRLQDGLRDYRFVVVRRGGMTLEEAQAHAPTVYRGDYPARGAFGFPRPVTGIPAPKVAPPDGYGYTVEEVPPHDAPHEGCSCGIYAASDDSHGYTGDVVGKVKLWGKVVPGEKGARAQYAYPSEFRVSKKLADHPALLAFGVPIIVDYSDVTTSTTLFPDLAPRRQPDHARRLLYFATALNIGACIFNLLGGLKLL